MHYIESHKDEDEIIDFINKTLGETANKQAIEMFFDFFTLKRHEFGADENYVYVIHQMLLYIPPFLLVIGILGNILAFIVLIKFCNKFSTYHFLYTLAAIDIIVLLIGPLKVWIRHLSGKKMEDQSDICCKMFPFIGYFSSDASVWLLIMVTIERLVVLKLPLQKIWICTHRRTKHLIIGILITVGLINSPFLWTMKLQSNNTTEHSDLYVCGPLPEYEHFVRNIWPWIDAAMYSFPPFVVISITNSISLYHILASQRRQSSIAMLSSQQRNNSIRKNVKLTVMLLALSVSFLVMALPINVVMLIGTMWNSTEHSPEDYSTINLVRTIAELLMYTHHATNFILYFCTGSQFRRHFRETFFKKRESKKRKKSSEMSILKSSVKSRKAKCERKGGHYTSV